MAGRRSANGEGTVYKRKDGRWCASAFLLTTSGHRKRFLFYGRTRKEAFDKLLAAQAQIHQGVPLPDKNWKLGAFLDHWLETAKRRPLTHRRHESIVRLHLKPGLAGYTLSSLTVRTVQHFFNQEYADGKTAATVHQMRKVLSAALSYAVRQELLVRNVARHVELHTYRPDEADHWNSEETRRFLNVAKSDPLYPLFVLLALYGLRSGEVRGLRWQDVDFDSGVLYVRQQVQRISGRLEQVELKTHASYRAEPLLPTAVEVLSLRRSQQAIQRDTAGSTWNGTGSSAELVFTTRTGLPIEARNVYRSFVRLVGTSGLRPITLHGLRHSQGTGLKRLHVPERDIQKILGHGNAQTTRVYEHVDLEDKARGLTKLEHVLFEADNANDHCCQPLLSGHEIVDKVTKFISGAPPRLELGTQGSSEPRGPDGRNV